MVILHCLHQQTSPPTHTLEVTQIMWLTCLYYRHLQHTMWGWSYMLTSLNTPTKRDTSLWLTLSLLQTTVTHNVMVILHAYVKHTRKVVEIMWLTSFCYPFLFYHKHPHTHTLYRFDAICYCWDETQNCRFFFLRFSDIRLKPPLTQDFLRPKNNNRSFTCQDIPIYMHVHAYLHTPSHTYTQNLPSSCMVVIDEGTTW